MMGWFKEKTKKATLTGVDGSTFEGTFGLSDNKDRQETVRWLFLQLKLGGAAYAVASQAAGRAIRYNAEIAGLVKRNRGLTAELAGCRDLVDLADKALADIDSTVGDLEERIDALEELNNTLGKILVCIEKSAEMNVAPGKKAKHGQ